jgi:hypothetical protein
MEYFAAQPVSSRQRRRTRPSMSSVSLVTISRTRGLALVMETLLF